MKAIAIMQHRLPLLAIEEELFPEQRERLKAYEQGIKTINALLAFFL